MGPCESNDNYSLTNDSNDLTQSWGLLGKRQSGRGSGCSDAVETEPDPEQPEDTEAMTFLSCHGASAEDLTDAGNVDRLVLEYAYEIHLRSVDAELMPAVGKFETDLLEALASKYGLSSCEWGEYGRRSLRRQLLGASTVVGIGSYPVDRQDFIHSECRSWGCDYCDQLNAHYSQ